MNHEEEQRRLVVWFIDLLVRIFGWKLEILILENLENDSSVRSN